MQFPYTKGVRKKVIGVMCAGDNSIESATKIAYLVGKLIAQEGWILLSGGRKQGAMGAVNEGAKSVNGQTVGIIPLNNNDNTSDYVDIAIVTGMGSARNNINILSSDAVVVIAEGMGAGTVSEAALALKAKKHIILLSADDGTKQFFRSFGKEYVTTAETPEETISVIKNLFSR